jgi:hypothetical protein
MKKLIILSLICVSVLCSNEIKRNSFFDGFLILQKSIIKLISNDEVQDKKIFELEEKVQKLELLLKERNKKEIVSENNKTDGKDEYLIATWRLNIRELPSINSQILETKKIGEIVRINNLNNLEWVELKNGGFVKKKRLIKSIRRNIITKRAVNLRNSPITTKETLIQLVKKNQHFKSIGKIKEWHVLDSGKFIYANNVSVIRD